MCGIAVIISKDPMPEDKHHIINRMLSIMSHRGPDGMSSISLNDRVALGHVRLAIVDLSSNAIQPMTSVSGRATITYNGELYNHKQLREELIVLGCKFKTLSDTEVILNAFELWGEACITKFNGMFAFAIYDAKDRTVFLARDRLGIKPLYFYQDANKILFASEIKAILQALGGSTGVDSEGLLEYLTFQNNYGSRTLVKNVKLFPAASYCRVFDLERDIKFDCFWESTIGIGNIAKQSLEERLEGILHEVTASQVDADVPVNAFMSGGLDSCALAAFATQKSGRIKTFTCGFDIDGVTKAESIFDERHKANLMASYIDSEHHEIVLKEDDFLALMSKWAWHAEEPRVGSSFPNFCTSSLAAKFTKVCLSGTGADELFGGYPWRYTAALGARSSNEFIGNYFNVWNRILPHNVFLALVKPILGSNNFNAQLLFEQRMNNILSRVDNSDFKLSDAAILFEMETFLQGLLISEDKVSMAHGLEVRVPFLDNRLIDFSLALPFNYKVTYDDNYHFYNVHSYGKGCTTVQDFFNGKIILRKILHKYVPPEIYSGRKQGFSPPFETWFRRNMSVWLNEEVFSSKSVLSQYLDMNVARNIFAEHVQELANHRLFIWSMVALYLFITKFLGSCFE